MENAADALKIAAAVLIFVVALSISITAFGEARATVTSILEYRDREYDYTYIEDNGTTQRIVGLETIVPTIYRAYKENYKIIFDSNLVGSDGLYKKKNSKTGKNEPCYSIDMEKENYGSNEQKERFILAILYGNKSENFDDIEKEFEKLGIVLNSEGIYDKIQEEVVENLGIYYQSEQEGEQNNNIPNANKTTKRVITYKSQ
ncbi:MAG TPA: hypothetical protein OIM61_03680 [Clostridiaceae bacterium]|jgi:hypothetical protein|nr:hypothetical protein [Clostridiaceae bacterium]